MQRDNRDYLVEWKHMLLDFTGQTYQVMDRWALQFVSNIDTVSITLDYGYHESK